MEFKIYQFALLGGILIGLSSVALILINGKILGISNIIAQTLGKLSMQHAWRYTFLIGLAGGSFILNKFNPNFFGYSVPFSYYEAILGGLLVGIGTVVGSGCTSGHGVCGISRLSKRSIVATLVFILTAVITVAVKRHIL